MIQPDSGDGAGDDRPFDGDDDGALLPVFCIEEAISQRPRPPVECCCGFLLGTEDLLELGSEAAGQLNEIGMSQRINRASSSQDTYNHR